MVSRRLSWHLENNNTFSDSQSGFRKGRSTEDLILKLEHKVRASLVNKQVSIAVFFDLKQAFDNVNINMLKQQDKASKAGGSAGWNSRQGSFLEHSSKCLQ